MNSDKDITLGEFLRHEREQRGITIEQVASATKVGVRILHSLEADHYAELPAKPFIRGFVNSYCRFISLDSKEVLSRFDHFVSQKVSERPNRESGHSGYAFDKKDGEQQSRTILTFAILGFIVLGVFAVLFLKPSLRHHRGSHVDRLKAAHETQPNGPTASPLIGPVNAPADVQAAKPPEKPAEQAAATPPPVVQTAAQPAAAASEPQPIAQEAKSEPKVEVKPEVKQEAKPVENKVPANLPGENPADPLDSGLGLAADQMQYKVIFKINDDVWVRYQVDDKPIRKFIVRKNKTLILRARNEIRVQVSDPEAVKFNLNGKGFLDFSAAKKAANKQGNLTVFFPEERADQIEKPFGNEKPLPEEVPEVKVDNSSQVPAPSP